MSVIKITSENFESEVLKAEKPVLVDFWAEWCGPCRMMAPVVEELEKEMGNEVKFAKINIDECPELAWNRNWYNSWCSRKRRLSKNYKTINKSETHLSL